MKKAIVILLLVLYSASTIGATINMHYCMNKFAGWSFISKKKDKCPNCGMTNTGCCKDEKKQIKLTLDQQKTANNQINHSHGIIVVSRDNSFFNTKSNQLDLTFVNNQNLAFLHSPPNLQQQETQAILSIFII